MKRVSTILKRWSTDQLITGIEVQDWVKLLAENEWKVSPQYFHRAAWMNASTIAQILRACARTPYCSEAVKSQFYQGA